MTTPTVREFLRRQREAKDVRKDIDTARRFLRDVKARYLMARLRARSKKQAEDLSVFADLEGCSGKTDIRDAYGYDCITMDEMDHLMELWDAREDHMDQAGKYSDRVTEMLDGAIYNCGEQHMELLDQADADERRLREEIKRIEKENAENDFKRRHGLML